MASHKYAVEQTVLVTHSRFLHIVEGERFQIVRHLPEEGRTPQYRIKSELDGHERIVREDEIDAVY